MHPLGNHIQISAPEVLNESYLITERENVMKAKVLEISPDVSVPFKVGAFILFYTGRAINLRSTYFVELDKVVMWKD
jgi:hypothetical protein